MNERLDPALPSLLCFPHAGGSLQTFRGWAEGLSANVLVADRASLCSSIGLEQASLAAVGAALLDGLVARGFDFSKKYFTFGHSLGALNGFEVVRALRGRKLDGPACAFFSAMSAPHCRRGAVFNAVALEDTRSFIAVLKSFDGTPAAVLDDADMMEYLLPVLKFEFSLLWSYRHGERGKLDCPISVLYGERDSLIPVEGVLEWRDYSDQCRISALPGDHFFVQSQARLLIAHLNSVINGE